MSLPRPILFNASQHAHLIPSLAQIHADCVLQDHTLATFLPNEHREMDLPRIETYWQNLAEQCSRDDQEDKGTRAIILQMAPSAKAAESEELAGYVSLWMPPSQTGPFRAGVEKLMVSPRHRQKGVARSVMGKLEEVAREKDRGLLILDTTIGSPAELVYPRLGYKEFGRLPKYGISPKDGKLVDEIFYYKDLRDEQQGCSFH